MSPEYSPGDAKRLGMVVVVVTPNELGIYVLRKRVE